MFISPWCLTTATFLRNKDFEWKGVKSVIKALQPEAEHVTVSRRSSLQDPQKHPEGAGLQMRLLCLRSSKMFAVQDPIQVQFSARLCPADATELQERKLCCDVH